MRPASGSSLAKATPSQSDESAIVSASPAELNRRSGEHALGCEGRAINKTPGLHRLGVLFFLAHRAAIPIPELRGDASKRSFSLFKGFRPGFHDLGRVYFHRMDAGLGRKVRRARTFLLQEVFGRAWWVVSPRQKPKQHTHMETKKLVVLDLNTVAIPAASLPMILGALEGAYSISTIHPKGSYSYQDAIEHATPTDVQFRFKEVIVCTRIEAERLATERRAERLADELAERQEQERKEMEEKLAAEKAQMEAEHAAQVVDQEINVLDNN